MTTTTDVNGIVADYLRRLDAALSQLPRSRRDQLVREITEHVNAGLAELPSQTEASVRGLLERVGLPEEIAAEAIAEQPQPAAGRTRDRRLVFGLIALIVLVGIGVGIAGLHHDQKHALPPPRHEQRLVVVPNVLHDNTPARAAAELRAVGLKVLFTRVHSTAPVGLLIEEQPAGAKVAIGSTITLTVSVGT